MTRTVAHLLRRALLPGALLLFNASGVGASPLEFRGTDAGTATVNADAAFGAWSGAAGAFTLDNLDGLTGSGGLGGEFTSSLGNRYRAADDTMLSVLNFSFAVLEGASLRLTQVAQPGLFKGLEWDLQQPVTDFGFFGRNHDGGTVSVRFMDGGLQEFTLQAASSNSTGDNFFFGLTGLGSAVQSVSIRSTDPGTVNNNAFLDRFVYATAVPAPASLALLLVGLALGALRARPSRPALPA